MKFPRVCITPALGQSRWRLCPEMTFSVGRSPACWVRIADRAVSAVHARLDIKGGRVLVNDMGSLSGVIIGGEKVRAADIELGREIGLAGWRLSVSIVDSADAPVDEMLHMLGAMRAAGRTGEMPPICRDWAVAAPKLAASQRAHAQAALDAGDASTALDAARRAMALNPGDPRSVALEAMALEALGSLDQARRAWDGAAAAGMDRVESAKALRRLDTKLDVFGKISRIMDGGGNDTPQVNDEPAKLQAGPFNISFLAPGQGDLVLRAHAMLVRAAETVEGFLDYKPTDVAVSLASEQWPGPQGAAALYNGEILLRAEAFENSDPVFLPVALAHEYVHLAVDRLSGGKCPRWLDEGLAQYITQNLRPADVRALQNALAAGALLPLEVLASDWSMLEDRALVDLAYAQAFSVAQYIVEKNGWGAVRDMLRQAAGGDPPSAAEIEISWLEWLS